MAHSASVSNQRDIGWIPYVAPFLVFILFLVVQPYVPVPQWLRLLIEIALFVSVSRIPLAVRPTSVWWSIALGVGVFVVWVGPDQMVRGYRDTILFHNSLVGQAVGTTPPGERQQPLFLSFRILVSVIAVPILEELFWRGFLMRWLIDRDFNKVRLGAFQWGSFLIVAFLFASEHGPYWDVGLITGLIYNWWMVRTGNLWNCIIAHAVTNACLATFVVVENQWQYWL